MQFKATGTLPCLNATQKGPFSMTKREKLSGEHLLGQLAVSGQRMGKEHKRLLAAGWVSDGQGGYSMGFEGASSPEARSNDSRVHTARVKTTTI
uniref:Uncharacterized protein n=1 Tax=Rhodopseudomonas palustris (strain BisA53) TaxID=316055 RepID=Q07NG8_RHOP5